MAHNNTILNQIASFLPRHDFEKFAKLYHGGQKFRSFTRWSQFMAMTIAQLHGRESLRDLVSDLAVQGKRIYHLGMKPTSRATLARVNEQQPNDLYRELFSKFSSSVRQKHHSIDPNLKEKFTSLMQQLSNFAWLFSLVSSYRKTKGAIKLHFGLDAGGYLPGFMNMTNGTTHDLERVRPLDIPTGSCVVFDRGYTDYKWYGELDKRKIKFITRLKSNSGAYQFGNRCKPDTEDVLSDYKVKLPGHKFAFRLIKFRNPESNKEYDLLTNAERSRHQRLLRDTKNGGKLNFSLSGLSRT